MYVSTDRWRRVLPQERQDPLFGPRQRREDDASAHVEREQGTGAPAHTSPEPGRADRREGKRHHCHFPDYSGVRDVEGRTRLQ